MAAEAPSRPGIQVGPTSEFSLFFHVKPGQGEALRERCVHCRTSPATGPVTTTCRSGSIHEARFVLFDDDTRLAFATSFDGSVGLLHGGLLHLRADLTLFDAIFRHTEGYEGLPDLASLRTSSSAQQTAAATARNYGGTVKEIRKAQRVNAAFQKVLDHPDAARGAARTLPWRRCWRRQRTSRGPSSRRQQECHVGPHLGPARAGRADRRHHRRLRVPQPAGPAASGPGAQHPAVRPARLGLLRRADLPVPAAVAGGKPARIGAVRGRRDRVRRRLRLRRTRRGDGRRAAPTTGHLHHTRRSRP